jgi:Flp pilus assembly pilin Flp
MEFLNRLIVEEEGQGLVEYTLLIGVLVLALWAAVTYSGVASRITVLWGRVASQLQ